MFNVHISSKWMKSYCVAAFFAGVFATSCSNSSDDFSGLSERKAQTNSNTTMSISDGGIGPDDITCAQDCSELDGPCVQGSCNEEGICITLNKADGFSCDDNDLCTTDDVCVEGVCLSTPKSCLSRPCVPAACDPGTGECVDTVEPNGSTCDVGDACIIAECFDAICVPKTTVDCSATPTDQCTIALCDRVLGCVATPRQNTACNDGDACTVNDACDPQGQCVGTTLDCASKAGPCRTGVCEAATGQCNFTNIANGTSCDDNTVCTSVDACQDGTCKGTLVDCGADQCNLASCDSVTGCSLAIQLGAPCDDADVCTAPDACDAQGKCVGSLVPNPPMGCP